MINNSSETPPGYDRKDFKAGILHIGVGNFHRAHEEAYTNDLVREHPEQRDWGICGVMLLPQDEKTLQCS